MKSGILIFMILSTLTFQTCRNSQKSGTGEYNPDAAYVQVVMFHLERRCASCDAVENETRSLLDGEYSEALKEGRVRFVSLDFQSESGKRAAAILRATGQTLYVISGDSISNLTSAAFMFAQTDPDFYRNALRKELDRFLK